MENNLALQIIEDRPINRYEAMQIAQDIMAICGINPETGYIAATAIISALKITD